MLEVPIKLKKWVQKNSGDRRDPLEYTKPTQRWF